VNLILLSISSEPQLLAVLEKIKAREIKAAVFYEPVDRLGFTAICTEPLSGLHRREFRSFPLWKPSMEVGRK
jgi:hypothetical protein